MEQETPNQIIDEQIQENVMFKVTPFSKYLALALFVLLPFVGGWIGYHYSPEKIVEIEKVVEVEVVREVEKETTANPATKYSLQEIGLGGEYFAVGDSVVWLNETDSGYYLEPTYEIFEIAGVDLETFEPKIVRQYDVPQGNTFQNWISRDKNNVYYRNEVIENADPETYRVSETVALNYDADHVFLWHDIIPNADPDTYELWLDTSTSKRGTVYGKDIRGCYKDYEMVDCEQHPFNQ